MADTQTATYRAALKEARASFDRSTRRIHEIAIEEYRLNDEVAKLRRTITALAALCSESPWADALGITDSCIEVMEIEPSLVSTQDVLKKLEQMGFDLTSQKNAAASVHAVLSRLAEKKKIEKVDEGGSVLWKGPKFTEISDDDIPF